MSLTMGWTESPPLNRSENSAINDFSSPTSPIRAPVADRRLSLAIPDQKVTAEATSKRIARRMSLRPGWVESQSLPTDTYNNDAHDPSLQAALTALEGFRPTRLTDLPDIQDSTVNGPSETTIRNIRKMSMAKRSSYYAQDHQTNRLHAADVRPYRPGITTHLDSGSSQQGNEHLDTQLSHHKEDTTPAVEVDLSERTGAVPQRMKRLPTTKTSQYQEKEIPQSRVIPLINFEKTPSQVSPEAISNALAALEGSTMPYREHSLVGGTDVITRMMKRKPRKRISHFIENDIPEMGAVTNFNSQDFPSQPDPAALKDALAALEGRTSPRQEFQVKGKSEFAPRILKRQSSKRVSMFLKEENLQAAEPEVKGSHCSSSAISVKSHRRKASVEYALAALQAPSKPQANIGQPRGSNADGRPRRTMSMYIKMGPSFVISQATEFDLEPRSGFDTDLPETEFESTLRKLKRLSWNVIGRALPRPQQTEDTPYPSRKSSVLSASHLVESTAGGAKRMSWMPAVETTPEPTVSPIYGTATNDPRDQPTPPTGAARGVEPLSRKTNRSWCPSEDPTVAEIQCGPRKEYGIPAPWLSPVVHPTRSIELKNGTLHNIKRISWRPAAKEMQPGPPSPLREVSLAMPVVLEESADDKKPRKKMNRISKFVFTREPKNKYTQEVFPQLGGLLESHPTLRVPPRAQTPADKPQMSRMKRFTVQFGRLFR